MCKVVGEASSPSIKWGGHLKLSQNYLICQNRSTMQCRSRFQTCPFFRNLPEGGLQTRAVQRLFATNRQLQQHTTSGGFRLSIDVVARLRVHEEF